METAIIYGICSSFSLVIGALFGLQLHFKQKTIASIMAFGSGVLICALTFGLIDEAFLHGGFDAVIIGFLFGGVVFILGDYLLWLLGARKHRRKQFIKSQNDATGPAITLGAILDGIPESIALGITLYVGRGIGLLMLVAIIISNLPEGIASVPGLLKMGFSKAKILGIWLLVGVLLSAIVIMSYLFLHDISQNNIGLIEAFAAGAILAMLADSMIPEAYEEGGFSIGLLTLLGFLTAFVISKI